MDVFAGYEVPLADYDAVLLVPSFSSPVITHSDVLTLPHQLLHPRPILSLFSLLEVKLEVVLPQLLNNLPETDSQNLFINLATIKVAEREEKIYLIVETEVSSLPVIFVCGCCCKLCVCWPQVSV